MDRLGVPGGLVSWGVQDGAGRWLPAHELEGERVVTGERGGRYVLAVRNETARRVEVVLSVDGLDVMNGRPASFSKRGYILPGRGQLRVEGFRTSSDAVAAFRFSSVSRSYTALRHGSTRNVGVIGIAVFTERADRRWAEPPSGYWGDPEVERRRRAEPFPRS